MRQLGGFREDFEFYGGDLDIVVRMRLAGYISGWCVPAYVTHVWGEAAKELGEEEYTRLRQVGNDQLRDAYQQYGTKCGFWKHQDGVVTYAKEEAPEQVQGQEDLRG
jgi:GT2 family glycosyltransferase